MHSLGTIVWECIVGTFPFSTPPPAPEDKSPIRKRLAEGILPWDISHGQEADQIYPIIRDCWSANPVLRPSAAFVAQTILDIVVRDLVPGSSATVVPHGILYAIKERVLEQIGYKKVGKKHEPITPDDARMLRQSADLSIDPVSSYLLGAAILYGLIPMHEQDDVEYASIELHPEGTEFSYFSGNLPFHPRFNLSVKRIRGALKYLDVAIDAGKDEALHECGKAHHTLGKYYLSK